MCKVMQQAACTVVAVCIFVACANAQSAKAMELSPQTPGSLQGYLSAAAVPSSASLVPAPPAPGSAAMARDEEINRSALAMNGTPRWDLAIRDSALTFPAVAATFSCALNVPIGAERTPKLIALLRRTLIDAGRATGEAKQLYKRTRPFVANGKPICTPDREAVLRSDGSYPSGHASIGWAFALVLSEVSPDQTDAILARGRAFGQSRLVCNVHWQSDVQEGEMVGAGVVARLHADRTFRADVAAARAEVKALHVRGIAAEGNCAAETQTLKSWN
jgi:acid phosphatase (class A)